MSALARNTVMVTTAAKRDDSNKVLEAFGRGPGSFGVACNPSGDYQNPITHYLMSDASMNEADGIIMLAIADNGGTPPEPTTGPDTWLEWFPGEANEGAAFARSKAACAVMSPSVSTNVANSVANAGAHATANGVQIITNWPL